MRPASEIHSSLDLCDSDLERRRAALTEATAAIETQDDLRATEKGMAAKCAYSNLLIVRDVLRWVAGAHWVELTDGGNPWLAAYLLDDPPKIDDTQPCKCKRHLTPGGNSWFDSVVLTVRKI